MVCPSILGLHAKSGFGEKSAAAGSDLDIEQELLMRNEQGVWAMFRLNASMLLALEFSLNL